MDKKINILSASASGKYFVAQLVFFDFLEKSINKPLSMIFDYFTGVSGGAFAQSVLLLSDDGEKPTFTAIELLEILVSDSHGIEKITERISDIKIRGLKKNFSSASLQLDKSEEIFKVGYKYFSNLGAESGYGVDYQLKDVLKATSAQLGQPHHINIDKQETLHLDGGFVVFNSLLFLISEILEQDKDLFNSGVNIVSVDIFNIFSNEEMLDAFSKKEMHSNKLSWMADNIRQNLVIDFLSSLFGRDSILPVVLPFGDNMQESTCYIALKSKELIDKNKETILKYLADKDFFSEGDKFLDEAFSERVSSLTIEELCGNVLFHGEL